MRGRKLLTVAAVLMAGLLALPGLAQASPKVVAPAPDFVKALAAPAKVEGNLKPNAVLGIQYQVQVTSYWCGPAATRIAMSARTSSLPSQATLASQLGTTTNGTDYIGQVTGVLNSDLGTGWYETKNMPNDPPTQAQRDLLWRDITLDVNNGYAIVANIVAPANNHPPGYPNYTIYHYFTVIGYDSSDMTVKIADPANFGGNQIYWLTFNQLATLIPPKGYSA
jgi:hypothetical protein